MRRILQLAFCAALTALPVVASADKLVTKLRVSVETYTIRRIDASTPTRVIFVGSPIKGEVALVAALLPSPSSGPTSMPLPAAEWWEHVVWSIEREGGDTPPFQPRWVSTTTSDVDPPAGRAAPALTAGQRLVVPFSVEHLPPGEYRLSARLGDLRSGTEWFLISDGKESVDLSREFARYQADRSTDPTTRRKHLLDVAAADPLNAGVWLRIADLSLADGSVGEILGYLDRAAEVLRKRQEMFGRDGRHEMAEDMRAQLGMVAAVRDLVPYYVANRKTIVLHANVHEGRYYVLRERATGRVLRTIGPQPEKPLK